MYICLAKVSIICMNRNKRGIYTQVLLTLLKISFVSTLASAEYHKLIKLVTNIVLFSLHAFLYEQIQLKFMPVYFAK